MKRKLVVLILASVTAVSLLGGCGMLSGNANEDESESKEDSAAVKSVEKISAYKNTGTATAAQTGTSNLAAQSEVTEYDDPEAPSNYSPTLQNAGLTSVLAIKDGEISTTYEYSDGYAIDADYDEAMFRGKLSSDSYFATGILIIDSEYLIQNSDFVFTTNEGDAASIPEGSSVRAGSALAIRDGSFVTIENSDIEIDGAWGDTDYPRAGIVVGRQSENTGGTVVMRGSTIYDNGNDENTSSVGYYPKDGSNAMKDLTLSGQGLSYVAQGTSVSYLYNDDVTGTGFGAISTDRAAGEGLFLYSVGTTAITDDGGYGVYADTGSYDYFFNSTLQGADFGCILGGSGLLSMSCLPEGEAEPGSIEDAALKYATESDISKADLKESFIIGGRNAVMGISDDPDSVGVIDIHDTTIETGMPYMGNTEDAEYLNGYDYYFAMCDGADILARSASLDISLVDTQTSSYSDTLIFACVDSASGGIKDSENAQPTTVYLNNVTSDDSGMDILNFDYQRPMEVTIENMTLTASLICCDYDDFEKIGYLDGIARAAGSQDRGGLSLTIESDAKWVVTGPSELTSLTIEEGGSIEAVEGKKLAVTVDGESVVPQSGSSYQGEILLSVD